MLVRKINNLIVITIILCSTGIYKLHMLGPVQRVAELFGVVLIVILFALHMVYSDHKAIHHNYTLPVVLILLSLVTSMLMAKLSRDQSYGQTLYAQRAIYYYLLYFVLHQLKVRPKDLERIIFVLGIAYVLLYLIQYALYPKIIYDAYVRSDRGTIRIYMPGSGFFAAAFLISIQYFYRTQKIRYVIFVLMFFAIHVLTGGRQTLVIVLFVVALFLIFDKKVKSKVFLAFLGVIATFALFFMFQGIFREILLESESDVSLGKDYIRFVAARYFLTDFFIHPMAYLTGNGMYFNTSRYGQEITRLMGQSFNLGDIGIIANYAIYGAFFIAGVFLIIIRSFRLKIEDNYSYIKYIFISIILSILTAGSFAQADFICLVMCIIYMIDVSNYTISKELSDQS